MKIKLIILSLILSISFQNVTAQHKGLEQMIARVTQQTGKNIVPKVVKSQDDFFEISSSKNQIVVKGNTPTNVAAGVNWYLKYYAGTHVSWNNLNVKLPAKLPAVAKPERRETDLKYRYYLNYCTLSYSMAFWDWERWEQELDWMALHGINLCLNITGNEVVWYNVLKRLGYTVEEINQFISGPAFMAWWEMNNLEGWGGPNPDEWYKKQEILQKKILARMNELGIEPIFPGFAGMVPRNIGEKLGYTISDPGLWNTIPRPAFLNPEDPNFARMADIYYEEMERLYGKANFYAMDPFHEGGNSGGIDLPVAGRAILDAMKRANPTAVWVAQGWGSNPRKEILDALNHGDMLALDLYSEKSPKWGDTVSQWRNPNGYGKHDWVYCMLLNFGGRQGLHGRMDRVINSFYDARVHPNGKTLSGVGTTPEAIENNPVMFELLYELPWRKERFTKEEWLDTYVYARYGKFDSTLREAWKLLADYPYNCPNNYRGEGTVESLFCSRPRINPKNASSWGSSILFYSSDYTRRAAEKMLSVADEFKDNANFCYDLVDVLRQSIADRGNDLCKYIAVAYNARDIKRFKAFSDEFLNAILCQDALLATQKDFRVGNWIEQAKALSENPDNQRLYEWNARTLITVWGNRDAAERGGLHDYSWKEWNGILEDLYYKRWKLFFDNSMKELQGESVAAVDYFSIDEAWTRETKSYGNTSEGDVVKTAREIYGKVFATGN